MANAFEKLFSPKKLPINKPALFSKKFLLFISLSLFKVLNKNIMPKLSKDRS
jgi:hypothetical protein